MAQPRRAALHLPKEMTFESWRRVGEQIGLIADSSAWWKADWLLHGERLFPDRYKRAIEETLLDYQTLRNYAWVARRFPFHRRRDRLSFQHHAEVASLPEEEQDVWLERAERLKWSRNRLRNEIRASRRPEVGVDVPAKVTVTLTVPSERERRWQQAADAAQCSLVEWMALVLDEAAVASPPGPADGARVPDRADVSG
ncbi:LmbU family transcriptional regulator [Streptosporangium fragile]|uniref:LmbU family transcriptional regulator n=1 Tax=Streptosporangium fragile TaxID=46186 RepID=UPI003CD06CC7